MNDTEMFTVEEISESLGVDVPATGEVKQELDVSHARRVIEAVLFAAGHPVTYAKLAEVLSSTPAKIRGIVEEYAGVYNSEHNGIERGIMLLCFDDCCQLSTNEAYGDYVRTALGIKRGGNLSASSLEVLAIIAYNEPVTRAYVDTVRGVDSSYAVTSLADKHMIEACGRLDVPGRPILYRTTPDFLRVFGLNSLADLPAVKVEGPLREGDILPIENMENTLPVDSIGAEEDPLESRDEAVDMRGAVADGGINGATADSHDGGDTFPDGVSVDDVS